MAAAEPMALPAEDRASAPVTAEPAREAVLVSNRPSRLVMNSPEAACATNSIAGLQAAPTQPTIMPNAQSTHTTGPLARRRWTSAAMPGASSEPAVKAMAASATDDRPGK